MYIRIIIISYCVFFFFNDTATTEIYTLSLHDALPISACWASTSSAKFHENNTVSSGRDRKSTRLNSSHVKISYAVFCLKKKKVHIPLHFGILALVSTIVLYNSTTNSVIPQELPRLSVLVLSPMT